MRQFEIFIENRVGTLANLCELLAQNSINIKAISTNNNSVMVVTEDALTTRNVLQKMKILFKEIEILPVRLLDRPGELAKLARMLLNAKINIDAIYILDKDRERGETYVALNVNKLEEARRILKGKELDERSSSVCFAGE